MSTKLKLPKKTITGLKTFCTTCKSKNPKCRHYDKHRYRMHVHIPNTKRGERSKILTSLDYDEALEEALVFRKQIVSNNYEVEKPTSAGNNYSLANAIMKYYQYLGGIHEYAHKRKVVSRGHREECYRYCKNFAEIVKKAKDISKTLAKDTSQDEVAAFYLWAEAKYKSTTFNKVMASLKAFYDFLIKVEKIEMENPFETYVTKSVPKNNPRTLTVDEFNRILDAVDKANPKQQLGGRGERKNMYYPFLKDAFRMFLLTGGRREELVALRWDQIYMTVERTKFFQFNNLKVMRQKESKNLNSDTPDKVVPINSDLFDLLLNMGYEELKGTNNYILCPNDRTMNNNTLMEYISKAFTHYRIAAGVDKDVSLRNLRKTYLSWVNAVLNKDTMILSSHSSNAVLTDHYLDRTVLTAIEKAALEVKIFGT